MPKESKKSPTVKGMFVNSHIKALHVAKGEEGIKELEKQYGKPLNFKLFQDVPIKEEVKILNIIFDMLSGKTVTKEEYNFEVGRFHFRNFAASTFGKILLSAMDKNFKAMVVEGKYIAPYVFKHVTFNTEDLGAKAVKIIMGNSDYPERHFKGVFYEWLYNWGYNGDVVEKVVSKKKYEYVIQWE